MVTEKILDVEDASPCYNCGSVQCAFCSEDIRLALNGFKKDYLEMLYNDEHKGVIPIFHNTMFELLGKWFPSFKQGQKDMVNCKECGKETEKILCHDCAIKILKSWRQKNI